MALELGHAAQRLADRPGATRRAHPDDQPFVAGGGRKWLFADDAALTKFELADAQPTSSGALIATYRPIR